MWARFSGDCDAARLRLTLPDLAIPRTRRMAASLAYELLCFMDNYHVRVTPNDSSGVTHAPGEG